MKANSAEIIKSMRKEMSLSQEEMAEKLFISVRQLARIEAGEAGMDIWQFITTLELLGRPTEDFWLLYLDSGEYASYRDYKRLKRQLGNDDWSEARKIIADFEGSPLLKQPVVNQYVTYIKTLIEITEPSASVIDALAKVMHIFKPSFDESKIAEYRMSYNEIHIALSMAECYAALGKHDKSISMVQAMINSRENNQVSEEDKNVIFPSLHFTLCRVLLNAGKHKEALRACDDAVEVSREYNNLVRIPEMLFYMANCYHKLGEEEHIIKTHLVRAYHVAYSIGRNEIAARIKEKALEHFNVVVP